MGKRDDRLIVEVDESETLNLSEWKKLCLGLYGNGGIKKRTQEIIKEDLKKMRKEK